MSGETARRSLGHLLQGLHRVPRQQPGVQRDGGKYVSQSHIDRGGQPSIVNAGVTPEIFSVLRARPLAGRLLLPEDGKPGAADVAVVSEDLWRSRFGSNPNLVGQSIPLDMRPFTVVGIVPASVPDVRCV